MTIANILNYCYRTSLWLFLFLVGVMPSGSIYGIPVKHMAIACLLAVVLAYVVKERRILSVVKFRPLLVALALISTLLLWVLITFMHNPEFTYYALSQWKGLALTIFLPAMLLTLSRLDLLQKNELESVFTISGVVFASLKVAIVLLIAADVVEIEYIVSEFSLIFGIGITHMLLGEDVYRLFVVNDLIVLFSLYLVISGRVRISNGLLLGVLAILFLSIFFAYSRVFFVASLGVAILALIEHGELKGVLIRLAHLTGALFVAGSVIWVLLNSDGATDVTDSLRERFNSEAVDLSDNTRLAQIDALWSASMDRLVLGAGLGSYLEELPRGTAGSPFSYEVQWLSYVYQLGIVGTLLLLCVALWLPFLTQGNRYSKRWWIATLLFVGWLAMPMTNPYLGNSTAGMVFSLFAIIFIHLDYEENSSKNSMHHSNI